VSRALCREHQRQQQHRPELADGARREQVGAELGVQLAGVREHREQRPDRGGRQRRADIHERDHDSRRGKRATEPVCDRERHRPAEQRERERPSTDARDVDLIAGEEEQHPQTEVGKEPREPVDLRDAKSLRPNHDAEHELEHNHRKKQPASARDRTHRSGHRRGHDDRKERPRVDAEDFPGDASHQYRRAAAHGRRPAVIGAPRRPAWSDVAKL
jgi:hypothetical protein